MYILFNFVFCIIIIKESDHHGSPVCQLYKAEDDITCNVKSGVFFIYFRLTGYEDVVREP